jgi:teichuronic acid biosynthesis glycosyltransferase TuaH
MSGRSGMIVYLAGDRWSDIPGTDRRIVTALGERIPVLWVDPPFSLATRRSRGGAENNSAGRSTVTPGVTRLQTLVLPGASRPGMRVVTRAILERSIRSAIRSSGNEVGAVVVSSPRAGFPRAVGGVRVFYVTDDWIAGAGMMGLPAARLTADLERNVRDADVVAAVSPDLADRLGRQFGVPVQVLANGCDPVEIDDGPVSRPEDVAGLVGQLNERLDPAMLEAVRAGGTPLVIIGPRTERQPQARAALDQLLTADGVTWHGELPSTELPGHLARMGVGLTPYADTDFNRASFPLKTLEYLANGLPVVSTDLPAVRWLDTDLIEVGTGPEDFASKVREVLSRPFDEAERARRIAFARRHSWTARAEQLLAILPLAGGQRQ